MIYSKQFQHSERNENYGIFQLKKMFGYDLCGLSLLWVFDYDLCGLSLKWHHMGFFPLLTKHMLAMSVFSVQV